MEQAVLSKVAIVVGVVAILCSVASLCVSIHTEDGGDEVEKFTVYFGLSDCTEEQAKFVQDQIADLIGRECGTGYTTYLATGGSMIDGALVKDGYTAVFIITLVDEDTIPDLIKAAQDELGIKVILLEKQYAHVELLLNF